jgi:ferredoxin/flavodoxin---NADP+ reductase
MYEIVKKTLIAPSVYRISIHAPHIAKKRKAGQFVIVIAHEGGERVPLTIASSDPAAGTVDIVFQAVGASTGALAAIPEGQPIPHVAGPLGSPTDVRKIGTVVVVGGGVGTAAALPIAVAMKEAGNRLVSILGGRAKEFVILEDDFRAASDKLIITTDDGSYGRKGFVTDALKDLISSGQRIDEVVAVGPLPMMRAVAETTRASGIHTVVSLNPIMIDGTGMCGGCRVTVDGKTRFACVDGPEFDGHKVDFAEIAARLGTYKDHERVLHERHKCRMDKA